MADLLALEDAVPTASSHTSHVEQLRTVDHVVVYSMLIILTVRLDNSDTNLLCAQHRPP